MTQSGHSRFRHRGRHPERGAGQTNTVFVAAFAAVLEVVAVPANRGFVPFDPSAQTVWDFNVAMPDVEWTL